MMPKFLAPIDLSKNELQNAVLQNLAVHPANPRKGQLYYNTVENTVYQYTGAAWIDLGEKYVHPNHTGDVTSTGDGATVIGSSKVTTAKIANKNVTDAKLADMPLNTIKGVTTAGSPSNLTSTQVKSILGISNVTNDAQIPLSQKGANNGVAELGSDGKVPAAQLPSYVDDVLEFAAKTNFPATGEAGKIYIATDTNLTFRWSGTTYVEISSSLALGETASTAYRGDRGKAAYDHSQLPHNAALVGLGNVNNTSDASKPISTAQQAALNLKADKSQVLTNVPANAKFTDTVYVHPNHSGDVTSTGDGATVIGASKVTTAKIADKNVTNAKLADMPANTIKGTNSGGVPLDLGVVAVKNMFNIKDIFPLRWDIVGNGNSLDFTPEFDLDLGANLDYLSIEVFNSTTMERVFVDVITIVRTVGKSPIPKVMFSSPPSIGENYYIVALATNSLMDMGTTRGV